MCLPIFLYTSFVPFIVHILTKQKKKHTAAHYTDPSHFPSERRIRTTPASGNSPAVRARPVPSLAIRSPTGPLKTKWISSGGKSLNIEFQYFVCINVNNCFFFIFQYVHTLHGLWGQQRFSHAHRSTLTFRRQT